MNEPLLTWSFLLFLLNHNVIYRIWTIMLIMFFRDKRYFLPFFSNIPPKKTIRLWKIPYFYLKASCKQIWKHFNQSILNRFWLSVYYVQSQAFYAFRQNGSIIICWKSLHGGINRFCDNAYGLKGHVLKLDNFTWLKMHFDVKKNHSSLEYHKRCWNADVEVDQHYWKSLNLRLGWPIACKRY